MEIIIVHYVLSVIVACSQTLFLLWLWCPLCDCNIIVDVILDMVCI